MANEKHIFIGLGGAGCQTVAQIKEKVYEKRFKNDSAAKSRLQQMNDSYRFLFLDTDQRDIDEANKRNRETFEKGKVPFISPQTDLINLGRANPQAIYYEAKSDPSPLINKRILEGCSREVAAKIPDQPLAFGAGAFRMKSRIAFAHALTEFHSKLQSAISALNDVRTVGGEDCIIYYWVVCSTLGGTGSGIINDVLYHVNQLHNQIVGNGDPQLVLTMYMPKVYIDSNATEEKYSLNAFAVFKEIQAFKEMSYDLGRNTLMHRLAFQNDYNLINNDKRYCPFYYLIPIDVQTDKGTSLGTTRTMYRNTAELLFNLHNGKAGATFRSDIDNYINDIMERDHKDFLVPMGYVSLQKPEEQFRNYMHYRLRRDVLRDWLLNEAHSFDENKAADLSKEIFRELELRPGTLISRIGSMESIEEAIQEQVTGSKILSDKLNIDTMIQEIDAIKTNINAYSKGEKREILLRNLQNNLWDAAERMIRDHGIVYAQDAIDAIRKHEVQNLDSNEKSIKEEENDLNDEENKLREAFQKANEYSTKEKLGFGDQLGEITAYTSALSQYAESLRNHAIKKLALDIRKTLCLDERNSELAILKASLQKIKGKAMEMSAKASMLYSTDLPDKLGMAALDVTTVYLPQLKNICDANGWIHDNFFARIYNLIVKSHRDKQETADRANLGKLINDEIYNSQDAKINKEIEKGQYKVSWTYDLIKGKTEEKDSVRFFTNPQIEDRNSEKILDDFLGLVQDVFDRSLKHNKEAQGRWFEQKVSDFFADLTNEEKDEVRRSLNPALFFSYNTSRIGTTTKEEHLVFVAPNSDLAEEMLGYQAGNPKHRFESSDNANTALVLKSKYGLALEDYRIFDSIKNVYERASFREKFHFHHSFAQFQEKLTLSDLPEDILPQHHTYAKILLLDKFRKELSPFFHRDEFEGENYTDSMLETNARNDRYFSLALPESLSIIDGRPALRKKDKSRKLFLEIEGSDFSEQFGRYLHNYHNYRFGETFDNLLSALITCDIPQTEGSEAPTNGEDVLKDYYTEKRHELLEELIAKKKKATRPETARLYDTLFSLVKEEYATVHDFIK